MLHEHVQRQYLEALGRLGGGGSIGGDDDDDDDGGLPSSTTMVEYALPLLLLSEYSSAGVPHDHDLTAYGVPLTRLGKLILRS